MGRGGAYGALAAGTVHVLRSMPRMPRARSERQARRMILGDKEKRLPSIIDITNE